MIENTTFDAIFCDHASICAMPSTAEATAASMRQREDAKKENQVIKESRNTGTLILGSGPSIRNHSQVSKEATDRGWIPNSMEIRLPRVTREPNQNLMERIQ